MAYLIDTSLFQSEFSSKVRREGNLALVTGAALLLGLCGLAGFVFAKEPAAASLERNTDPLAASERSNRNIRVAQNSDYTFSVERLSGPAGVPLPVRVHLPPIPDTPNNLLIFRFLPKDFRLSSGFRIEDRWIVSLLDLEGLTLTAPSGFSGSFNMETTLRQGLTARTQTRLVKVDIRGTGTARAPAVNTNRRSSTAEVTLRAPRVKRQALGQGQLQISGKAEARMMRRAVSLIKTGDISGARLLYVYLAKKRSAKGAYALAETYDPLFLSRIGAAGLEADLDKAMGWYRKAADLGSQGAHERLSAFAAPSN